MATDEPAQLLETHLSYVLLLPDRVLKWKKAVRYPFIDLRSLEQRARICEREVALNRRLAPDVYDGVATVVGPDGEVAEHVVVMRRLPASRRLAALATAGDPRAEAGVTAVAERLAEFHARAVRSPALAAHGDPEQVRRRWTTELDELDQLGSAGPTGSDPVFEREPLVRVRLLARAFLEHRAPLFGARVSGGHLVDGHGDLQADDVFLLDDGPRIIDCLEFDDDLRVVDVVDDAAFLGMDLERLGRRDLATGFLRAYLARSDADPEPALVDVFMAYRALVRAKVSGLRARQEAEPDREVASARSLLELAVEHLERAEVRLVLVGGAPGTGKSTVAGAVARRRGWHLLRSDVVRKELAGLEPVTAAGDDTDRGLYLPEHTARTYEALLTRASAELVRGRSVVLDATWSQAEMRSRAATVAARCGARLIPLRCELAAGIAAERIARRRQSGGDASDADAAVAATIAARFAPWPDAATVDTSGSVEAVTDRTLALVGPGPTLADGS